LELKNEDVKSKSKGTMMILVLNLVSHEVLERFQRWEAKIAQRGESSREREERDGGVGKRIKVTPSDFHPVVKTPSSSEFPDKVLDSPEISEFPEKFPESPLPMSVCKILMYEKI